MEYPTHADGGRHDTYPAAGMGATKAAAGDAVRERKSSIVASMEEMRARRLALGLGWGGRRCGGPIGWWESPVCYADKDLEEG